jgi:predicted nucleic acid-binding protein
MEPAILGLVLNSTILVAAERAKLTTPDVIKNIRASAGDVPSVICALTVAELAHGIYRVNSPERSQQRRQFLDELKAQVPVHPVTEATAEIARIGGEQAAKGINLPLGDLIIGACALELGYAIGTSNARDFNHPWPYDPATLSDSSPPPSVMIRPPLLLPASRFRPADTIYRYSGRGRPRNH